MSIERNYVQENRASTERLRRLVGRLTDEQLQVPLSDVWTVAVCLAHLAFWDRRVIFVMERTAREGKLFVPNLDTVLNEISAPIWAAIPPREAARLAVESADACDKDLEALPRPLVELMHASNPRLVLRTLHRNEHMDEIEVAIRKSAG